MAMVSISRGDAHDDEQLPCSVGISTVGLLVQVYWFFLSAVAGKNPLPLSVLEDSQPLWSLV
ncbi:uncharacterized protein DS421_14g463710 [Arachis hypogaea]|nr:uncharacterized protein DS421_14g463710 [Arachis hypogaea]